MISEDFAVKDPSSRWSTPQDDNNGHGAIIALAFIISAKHKGFSRWLPPHPH